MHCNPKVLIIIALTGILEGPYGYKNYTTQKWG